MRRALLALAGLILATLAGAASGHAASTAYLDVGAPQGAELALQWTVSLRDLDSVLDLDGNADGRLTWREVVAREREIAAAVADALRLTTPDGAACPLRLEPLRYTQLESGGYAVVPGRAACPHPVDSLRIAYTFLAAYDASHRVLLTTPAQATPAALAPGRTVTVQLRAAQGASAEGGARGSGFFALLSAGVAHILGGADHLLFLVALLLPSVLERRSHGWVARAALKPALIEVARLATAFTLAHSLTLALASFHVVTLSARFIEPLIAATVLAAALNNLKPVITRRLAAVAFCFGLVHGFGFAEVLAPLELPTPQLALALAGFNLGVEAGQLAIVAGVFALLALVRRWYGYPRWILAAGSSALAVVAGLWIVERVFDVPLLALAFAAG